MYIWPTLKEKYQYKSSCCNAFYHALAHVVNRIEGFLCESDLYHYSKVMFSGYYVYALNFVKASYILKNFVFNFSKK